jgi:uncharacterized membrane protein YeiH
MDQVGWTGNKRQRAGAVMAVGSVSSLCGRPESVPGHPVVLLVLDLVGTFAFALNGALTAVQKAAIDVVGVITLGVITAVGGGIIRDLLLGAVPPATFVDWRYLAVAAGASLLVFLFSRRLHRFGRLIDVMDAAGLSLFAVTGATKALELGTGPAQAAILGTITAVGGGTLRDGMVQRVPGVLTTGLYAIPALVAATLVGVGSVVGLDRGPVAITGAAVCFAVRMVGLRFDVNAPHPVGVSSEPDQ